MIIAYLSGVGRPSLEASRRVAKFPAGAVPGMKDNGAPQRPVYVPGGKQRQPRAYFLRKRSTRPPVSTIFCLPV